jgi:hypothetical protein
MSDGNCCAPVSIVPILFVRSPIFLCLHVSHNRKNDPSLWDTLAHRQRLALSIGPNWVSSTWRQGQNPVSKTLRKKRKKERKKDRTMDNVQICDSYITLLSKYIIQFATHSIIYFSHISVKILGGFTWNPPGIIAVQIRGTFNLMCIGTLKLVTSVSQLLQFLCRRVSPFADLRMAA